MKIRQTKQDISPVTITLETQKELDDIIHLFSLEHNESLDDYCDGAELTSNEIERLKQFNETIFEDLIDYA